MKEKLEELIKQGYENETVEFKEAKTTYDFNKLGKYFSALSNEANLKRQPAAWLVFGIRDKDKSYVNTQFRFDRSKLESLKAEVAHLTTNRITFIDIHEIQDPKGRVILFEIPAAPKGVPIAWKGHYYGRDGEELNALNIEEIERIRSQVTHYDWSAEVVKNATLNDLSEEAIATARKLYATKNPRQANDMETWDNQTFLNKAKITIKSKITRTTIILLGKSESEHFISPATSKLTWILKDKDNLDKDYEHFYCPLILSVDKLYAKIRNLKYRYIATDSLFPEEVDQYEPYIIREALHNCIAHQDYSLGGRVTVVENEDGKLIFSNMGKFIPSTVEEVVISDAPEFVYRNKFLAEAMVNLGMIDTIGSGIRKMFILQKNKFFPLPDYDITQNKVKVTIIGKVMDENYTRKLASVDDLSLAEVIALDKVAKGKDLSKEETKQLRAKKLIEGRKPNLHISVSVAEATGEKVDYIKLKGFDEGYYRDLVLKYLDKFNKARRTDFVELLVDKLPDILDDVQKENKIKNLLQRMKKDNLIKTDNNRYWVLV